MSFLFGGGSKSPSTSIQQPVALNSLRVQTSVYGLVIPVIFGKNRVPVNLIWYGDFTAIPHNSGGGGGGGGGGKGGGGGGGGASDGSVTYTYTASVQMALGEGPIRSVGTIWKEKEALDAASLAMSVFLGDYAQAPWSYLVTAHPSEALNYRGIAYIAASNYDLGDNAQLPNHTAEVLSVWNFSASIDESNPKDVVTQMLTNTYYGGPFASANLGDLTQYSNYCVANGIFLSPVYDQQKPLREHLKDLTDITNSAVFMSGSTLKIVPFGDQAVTGNGVTFTPDLTPKYDLTDNDFLPGDKPGAPVTCMRTTPADAANRYQIEHVDKTSDYNVAISEAKDQGAIDTFGAVDAQVLKFHGITDLNIGRFLAQLMLQRGLYVRNHYLFRLPMQYCLLEPMDLVTLTDSGMGLNRQLVRILNISEDDQGELSVETEQVDVGVAAAPQYGTQANSGFVSAINADPGNVNAPMFFEGPVQLSQMSGGPAPGAGKPLVCYAAVSGGTNWGGCEVWISTDGATYKRAGIVNAASRMGVLTAPLPVGTDPDTTNTLAIDLTQSRGTVLSGTQDDADSLRTLCVVENELVAYETALLTSTYHYSLTYLRRGALGTAIAAHATNANFFVLDNAPFIYPYAKEDIGSTIYIKFLSFNLYGAQPQAIEDVSAYTRTLVGLPLPGLVQNFSARQTGGAVQFSWTDLTDFGSLKGYDIGYAPRGTTDQSQFSLITEASRATEMTTVAVAPGTWTFGIWGHNIADQLGPVSYYDLTVTNPNTIIYQADEAPDWLGTLSGFRKHWTGVLVPDSTKLASQLTKAELFEQFVPYPVTDPTYTTTAKDTALDASVRLFALETVLPGRGVTGAPAATLYVDTWLTGQADPNTFQAWTIGQVTLRYFRARLLETTSPYPAYISSFIPTVDASPTTQQGASQVIAPGGTAVFFAPAFHSVPLVIGSVIGNSALIFAAQSPSGTGFTAHVFDKTGADVGGTINWQATGT